MIGFISPGITITCNHTQLQQLTINDCLRLALFWLDCNCLLFYCDWLCSDLRVTHFWFTNELRMTNNKGRITYE
jgi:hypothetical protein